MKAKVSVSKKKGISNKNKKEDYRPVIISYIRKELSITQKMNKNNVKLEL